MYDWKHVNPKIVQAATSVVKQLLDSGYEAYWVGGCVRDELLGRVVKDMDITTSATPAQVMDIFEHCIPTGIQHGTVTVCFGSHAFEVTTFRTESEYVDRRHPMAVKFVNEVERDLKRRDFTINAMAMSIDGLLIDPFGGQNDIVRKTVRCVGLAKERFSEDALRMLRCIRFAASFTFTISHTTWRALLQERHQLKHIAMERVRAEVDKMLTDHPRHALHLLKRSQLLEHVKRGIHTANIDEQLLINIHKLSSDPLELRWALVLLATPLEERQLHVFLRAWAFSNISRRTILGVLQVEKQMTKVVYHSVNKEQLRSGWIETTVRYGIKSAQYWLQLDEIIPITCRNVHLVGSQERWHELKTEGFSWLTQMPVQSVHELVITGEDVLNVTGRKAGPWLGIVLQKLLLQVAKRCLLNERQTLLQAVQELSDDETYTTKDIR